MTEDPALCRELMAQIANLKNHQFSPIVVHGGGKEITKELDKLQRETKFINGLRYTDAESMRVVEMLLSGVINKRITSSLNLAGAKAVGISGRDAKMFCMSVRADLGFVGEVEKVDTFLVELLLQNSFIPCISPIGEDLNGNPLNVNADEAARAVAEALRVEALVYLSDVDGLMIGGKLIKQQNQAELKNLIAHPDVTGGMIPKLQGALHALQSGIEVVKFLNGMKPETITPNFLDNGSGTTFLR